MAVEALNRGAALAGCLHNTGEGGLAPAHQHGGELIYQIGTGYFGCRDEARALLARAPAGAGGRGAGARDRDQALPGRQAGPRRPAARGEGHRGDRPHPRRARRDATARARPRHSAFDDVDGLIEFVERIADATGLPVGIKSAVGELGFWEQLATRMAATGGGPDFVTVDGGEGGTGAAPLTFSDHVALPFKLGVRACTPLFARAGLAEDVVFIGAGRLGFPDAALLALALGCDMINVGREAMLAIGCIQAQRCHTGRCPTGVATHNPLADARARPGAQVRARRELPVGPAAELLSLARPCGVRHPALSTPDHIEIVGPALHHGAVRATSSATSPSGRRLDGAARGDRRAHRGPGAGAAAGTRSR